MTLSNQLKPVPAKLVAARTETYDTTTYSFELPERARSFEFDPGQFNMLSLVGAGEAPISISGYDPENGIIHHTIRHVGNVTNSISRLAEGDEVHLRGPYGRGWPLDSIEGKHLVVLAGGIGLPPLVPALQYALEHRDSYVGIDLLFGARSVRDRLFHAELKEWERDDRMVVHQAVDAVKEGDEWDRHVGFVTELIPEIKAPKSEVHVLMCGPEIMMKVAAGIFEEWGLKPAQMSVSLERRMKCGLGTCGHCQIGPFFVCKDGPVFNRPLKPVQYP